jgi:hypothetical protein
MSSFECSNRIFNSIFGGEMEHRYRALRTIASIYRIMGYIVLGLTILVVLAICGASVISGSSLQSLSQQFGVGSRGTGIAESIFGGLIASLFAILYGGITSISLIGIGEAIYLFIAVEENTRKTALLLENQNKSLPAVSQD